MREVDRKEELITLLECIILDSLIDNSNLLETNSIKSSASINFTDTSRDQKENSFSLLNQSDFEDKQDNSNNSNSSLVLTRNRSKTNISSVKVKSYSQTSQPKKTIFSYLVERQQQLKHLQNQSSPECNSNQSVKQADRESDFDTKKIQSRCKRSKRSESTAKSKRQRSQRLPNQPTESSVASSSSSQTNSVRPNSSNIVQHLSTLYERNNREKLDQIFSTNSLFNSSQSLLTKLDLKVLFQPAIFESLPRQSQLKLIKLLPECDRLFDSHGSFKLGIGALNNEFIKKCCSEWQQKLSKGYFDNLETSSNQTTVTRSTRLKQQKLLESLASNENETSDNDCEESFYFDDILEANSDSQIESQICDQNNDKSIYESAESETNSLNSDFEDTNQDSDYDNQTSASDQSYSEFLSFESDQESIDEDLELKRKELEREAKRLIRKKEKLSSKILNSDCMISNSESFSEPIRKSLRKRTLSKKFTDDEYSLNEEEPVDVNQCKHEVSLDEQKGEFKLKIKRVTNASNLNRLNALDAVIDDLPSKRKRANSSNFKSSLNNSPLNLFPELSMPICSPAVSPRAVSPSKMVIKSNSSPPVPPPPLALPLPPHNIFNDEEDEENAKKDQFQTSTFDDHLAENAKNLAKIKNQIAEKKRKFSDELASNKRSKSIDSNLSIQKIVSELKSIGSNSNDNDNLSSSASTPDQKIAVDEYGHSQTDSEDAKLDIRDLPNFLVNLDLVDLIKSQQDKEKKLSYTRTNSFTVDTNFLTESLENYENNVEITLPNINSLILKLNPPIQNKTIKENTFSNQFVTPMPVQNYPQTPNRVIQPVQYQNGYQTTNRPNFVTSSPNYQKQSPSQFQYASYPPQVQSGQYMPPPPSQAPQQSHLQIPPQMPVQQIPPNQMPPQQPVQRQQMPQQPIQHQQMTQQPIQQQIAQPQMAQQQIVQQQIASPQMPQQFNQQYANYNQFSNQQVQQSQGYQQNVVVVQSPLKYAQTSPQVYAPQSPMLKNAQSVSQTPIQTNIKPMQQGINVSIPQQMNTNQNLANTLISPINSQNSQSSPNVQSVTPSKTKRKEKEKNLNVSTTSTSLTPSQSSSNTAVNQTQAQSSQSRSARSTQHQLTVAQLLSQKHQQQQQQKSQELNRSMTSPLTLPTVIQVNEQSNSNSSVGSQIIIPASLTSNSQTSSQVIKLVSDSDAKSCSNNSIQSNCSNQNSRSNSNVQFSSSQTNVASSLSIPTPLSQSTQILLNDSNTPSPQTVTCIPLSSFNFKPTVNQSNSLLVDSAKESDKCCDMPSQSQSNDKSHECSSKKAMVECEKCMHFCHDDCIYLKKIDSRVEPMRLCASCFNEYEKKMDA